MNKYLIELVGTFFLTLVVSFTANPLAIGGALVALVYMGGYISGAHYNPAVTIAVYIRGKIEKEEMIRYIVCQILGAALAAYIYFFLKNDFFFPKPAATTTFLQAVLLEALGTFLLCSVILHVVTSQKTKDNQYFGLAIGLTLMAIAFTAGPITGGVFNPAIGLGSFSIDLANFWHHLQFVLIYLIGPGIGGFLAGKFYTFLENHAEVKARKHWFRAKSYGWGWQPVAWQGWLVLGGYIFFILNLFFSINKNSYSINDIIIAFFPGLIISTAILLGICFLTGETPSWRWKNKN